MSIDYNGIKSKLKSTTVTIEISENNPLIQLANIISWDEISKIVIEDLKNTTTKLFWWLGRKLKLRIHLSVFFLQTFTKLTDRDLETNVTYNALYQVFCGCSIINNWHCPDHTKIEKFRNRIQPATKQKLVSYIVKLAEKNGFADPTKMDVDSTVQEANMTYPADARLLVKLSMMCKKVLDYIKITNCPGTNKLQNISINVKKIKEKAKEYFFIANNKSKEIKHKAFKHLYGIVYNQLINVIDLYNALPITITNDFKWNIKRTINQIQHHAVKYLADVKYFIKTQTMKAGKILSFHLNKVACIKKGKAGKDKEFGRAYQLGRIGGNFLIVLPSTTIREEDKISLLSIVTEHENIFGKNVLKSITADKKYYSNKNIIELENKKISEIGIQYPCNIKNKYEISEELKNRRAGIEPLIGHAKKYGLGKSKMKSDDATLAEGYRAIMGFDLHQFIRCLSSNLPFI
jgi:hypothetical protein